MSKIIKRVSTLLVLAVLSGCAAAPANKQAMIVSPVSQVSAEQKGKFVVNTVAGGKATNPFWTSQVSNENFEAALKESLALSGLSGPEGSAGKYKIDAELVSLKQPVFGLTFDVVSTVNYKVAGEGVEKVFPIVATGTATTSDAFVAITRLKIANEKSIQENIKAFIQQLSSSTLK
ncbi:hypothetical protein [Methylophilus aquaticus]|uniref:Lipoprotein n=1 Tax=Methylophilus aquaticus TaxID=1971610 RepID=A0ABT9JWD4_9PROT|nr:hypothetical protein [Methylophilus aquaticus]MDP8568906.1 hypothetical protein [Methylophilus aquaticus]